MTVRLTFGKNGNTCPAQINTCIKGIRKKTGWTNASNTFGILTASYGIKG